MVAFLVKLIQNIMIRKTIFMSLWVCLLPAVLTAQENYLPGYILKDGAKKQGQIDNQNWDKNPAKIQFKGESGMQVLSSTDIQEFEVGKEYYVSRVVDLDVSPHKLNSIKENVPPKFVNDTTLFLRVLVQGELSLYSLKDRNDKQHFFVEKNGETSELSRFKQKKKVKGQVKLFTEDKYKKELAGYFADCAALKAKTSTIKFTRNHLQKVVRNYNKCMGENLIVYERPTEKMSAYLGPLVGFGVTSLNIHSEDHDMAGVSYSNSSGPTFGLAFTMELPRNSGRWNIYSELLYYSYAMEGEFREDTDENRYRHKQFNVEAGYLKYNLMVRYIFQTNTVKPFLGFGIGNAIMMSDNMIEHYQVKNYSSMDEGSIPILGGVRKHEQALIIEGGISLKNFNVALRYERGNGFTPTSNVTTRTTFVGVQASYQFRLSKKK